MFVMNMRLLMKKSMMIVLKNTMTHGQTMHGQVIRQIKVLGMK